MAVVLGNTVWEGTSLEMESIEAPDGHFYKQLDTGESFIRRNGAWQFINLGLSFIKATKSGIITTDVDGFHHVTFVTPFFDTNYSVALSVQEPADIGARFGVIAYKKNKTISGFDIQTRDTKAGAKYGGATVSWLATRHYNP